MLPVIDMERLRTFYIAAKAGKFNAAAEELGMDNSSVTRQIQNLERDLNCLLFERGGFRGLQLTEQGQALHAIAYEILSKVAEIQPTISQIDNKLSGPLRVCVHGGYSLHFLSSHINQFAKKYPKIFLEIIVAPNILDMALREADIAICPNIINNNDLIEKELFNYKFKLYASKEYIKNYGKPEKVEDLKNHRFVSASGNFLKFYSKINWYLDLLPGGVLNPHFISNAGVCVEKAIKEGVGIGSFPSTFVSKDDPNLEEILPHVTGPKLTMSMFYGAHFEHSKKVETLYKFLLEKGKSIVLSQA
jgi:DNA-binding transcriptional LysR family regulator